MTAEPIPVGGRLTELLDLLLEVVDQQRDDTDPKYADFHEWGDYFVMLSGFHREVAGVLRDQILTYADRSHGGNETLKAQFIPAALKMNTLYTKFGETRAAAEQFVTLLRQVGGPHRPDVSS
jgi:hypothetical protein